MALCVLSPFLLPMIDYQFQIHPLLITFLLGISILHTSIKFAKNKYPMYIPKILSYTGFFIAYIYMDSVQGGLLTSYIIIQISVFVLAFTEALDFVVTIARHAWKR
jgi:hypothetical protein